MPKFHVEKSVKIDAPTEKVYEAISDFHKWPAWSPWLIMEPEAKVNVSETGKFYNWHGNRVGEGEMSITSEQEPNLVDYDLKFLKPWKSQSKVKFEVKQENGSAKATWHMDGSLPFFMFWMKKMMTTFVGMDYERGLGMLKDYVEKGEVPSKLEFTGETTYEGCKYVGIKTTCAMDQVGPAMQKDFERLGEWLKDETNEAEGDTFSIYHKWDMNNQKVTYTSGVPVKDEATSLPAGFIKGVIPPIKTYCITHIGPYRHLGNAWSTGMNMSRAKAFKTNKKVDPFETYPSDPHKVPENDLVTRVFFPIK